MSQWRQTLHVFYLRETVRTLRLADDAHETTHRRKAVLLLDVR